jgi:hypothetical protein
MLGIQDRVSFKSTCESTSKARFDQDKMSQRRFDQAMSSVAPFGPPKLKARQKFCEKSAHLHTGDAKL